MMSIIKWLGVITGVFGAFAVANTFYMVGYISFVISSAAWLYTGWRVKDNALMALNGIFFLANLMGLYNAI